jgi:hypothetical protein
MQSMLAVNMIIKVFDDLQNVHVLANVMAIVVVE